MTAHAFLLLLGVVLVLAFVAEGAFNRLRVPPVLVLIACGLVLGPVGKVFPVHAFLEVAPHFGSLAFLLILFEAGLDLRLEDVLQRLAPGARLAAVGFFLAGATATGLGLLLGLPLASAALLGLVLAPISGAIVIPLASRLGLPQQVTTLVVLEGALADVLGVLTVSLASQLVTGGGLAGVLALGSLLAAAFSVLLAAVAGVLWPRVLRALREHRFLDVLTFGVALTLWGGVEALGASGALAVLTFAVVLANESEVLKVLGWPAEEAEQLAADAVIYLHAFIAQLTFLVRAFFFVFLGVVVNFRQLPSTWLLGACVLVAVLVVARGILLRKLRPWGEASLAVEDFRTLWMLQPRGLVNAVLALEVAELGLPGSEIFLPVISLVIALSNLLLIFGIWRRPLPP